MVLLQSNFETRSKLHINLYIMMAHYYRHNYRLIDVISSNVVKIFVCVRPWKFRKQPKYITKILGISFR